MCPVTDDFPDINAGGFRYSVLSVITEASVGGSSSGPTAGAQTCKIVKILTPE
jgi:hypothetical protein